MTRPRQSPEPRGMTLSELRAAYPELFYAQNWFRREAFMKHPPLDTVRETPVAAVVGVIPKANTKLPRAVDLAHAFVRDPLAPEWALFWWCADCDALGQRVYVGGVGAHNNHKFEIHRHLAISEKWAVAA